MSLSGGASIATDSLSHEVPGSHGTVCTIRDAVGDCVKGETGSIYIVSAAPTTSHIGLTCLVVRGDGITGHGVVQPGVRYNLARSLQARFDWGVRLVNTPVQSTTNNRNWVYFSIIADY